MPKRTLTTAILLASLCIALSGDALGEEKVSTSSPQDVITGAPPNPSEAWKIAAGGRIYDVWWDALGRTRPRGTNPSYPASGKRSGSTTWRCVECHGWDYKGAEGVTAPGGAFGERYTGIKGLFGASGRSLDEVARALRSAPHNYTPDMLRDAELEWVALFTLKGLHDADRFIDRKTGRVEGDPARGAAVFQTVCATCHGFDGKTLNWGKPDAPAYVGTEAASLPWEVLHKIRNSHPGAAMVSLRAFPIEVAIDVLAYAQSLPKK
ncbi:MAG: cytochrome c [Hyphomicrobiaceae bacterium]|nr:cytochrome c [Hyphomicrobiaceae bacterium]